MQKSKLIRVSCFLTFLFFLFPSLCYSKYRGILWQKELLKSISDSDKSIAILKKNKSNGQFIFKKYDDKYFRTPLFFAVQKGNLKLVQYMLEQGVDPNFYLKGTTPPIHGIMGHKDFRIADLLLEYNANIDAPGPRGRTALHIAATDYRLNLAFKYLLEHGADVNTQSNSGLTPLHLARNDELNFALMKYGAKTEIFDCFGRNPNFDLPDNKGWTPLHNAISFGQKMPVLEHINNSTFLNATDVEGWTPLHVAVRTKRPSYVRMLLGKGALATLENNRGEIPLELAVRHGFEEIKTLLKDISNGKRIAFIGKSINVTLSKKREDKLVLGQLLEERPTFKCLGVRWYIKGDQNRNASMEMEYRRVGDKKWKKTYPALRVGGEIVDAKSSDRWITPHMLAGSIVDLEEDTSYEVKLTAIDPDGIIDGEIDSSEKIGEELPNAIFTTMPMRTRKMPVVFPEGKVVHVYHESYQGKKERPFFFDIEKAYRKCSKGDTLLIHDGNYILTKIINFYKKATFEKPIVIRGESFNVKIFTKAKYFYTSNRAEHHIFENITFTGSQKSCFRIDTSVALAIRNCRFIFSEENGGGAVMGNSDDLLIMNNLMIGDSKSWFPRHKSYSIRAVQVGGRGGVICYNTVKKFWDGLDLAGHPHKRPREAHNAAFDFYNNDISECIDDGIEAEYGVHNIRFFRNWIRNSYNAFSVAPVYGGPAYFFRNVIYESTKNPFKLNRQSSGFYIFHNTSIGCKSAGSDIDGWQNGHIFNNILMGNQSVGLEGGTSSYYSRMDYNAYHFGKVNDKTAKPAIWRYFDCIAMLCHSGPVETFKFRGLVGFLRMTQGTYDRNSFVTSFSQFVDCPRPNITVENQYRYIRPNLFPAKNSNLIDAGIFLEGFSENFTGKAPDVGAYEVGQKVPHYGIKNIMVKVNEK